MLVMQRRYFFYSNPQRTFYQLGYISDGLPGVVLYRSGAFGTGEGRALLVWPLRSDTRLPSIAIPEYVVVRPPFQMCSAAEALERFDAYFSKLRWRCFEAHDAQLHWNVPDLVTQFRRHLEADTQELVREVRQTAA